MPSAIEDYALIGDCETAALVGTDGSMDWLCWPRFDSCACFASLIGGPENGRWQISPTGAFETRRRYREHTLILETIFETATGKVILIDFMPLRTTNSDIVRLVRGVAGQVDMKMELVIRFDYGRTVPWVERSDDDGTLVAIAGPDKVVLRSSIDVHGEDLKTVSQFIVREGETVSFTLTYGASHLPNPIAIETEAALVTTEAWWREWASRCTYHGPRADVVERSLITLKALTYEPTGGIVAAPTTSLPEQLGGSRNWDYRFCWLRDATFTLLALMEAGYYDEAEHWRNWLVRAAAGAPDQLQILYGVAGERQFFEWEVPWLAGYRNSSPVRVGNGAAGQLQLDVFGEIADALHQAREGRLKEYGPAINLQVALTQHLEKIWMEPDRGIWETRGDKHDFTHSKVMAWVAFDRMIKGIECFGMDGPLEHWKHIRTQIHEEVCRRGFDSEINSFVQFYGSKDPDASLLLLPLVGFLPVTDPRMIGTIKMIEERLMWKGFVRRYDTARMEDGLPAGEGTFLACSFWLADNYVLMGRRAEAQALLDRLVSLTNDVGLLAEEYHPDSKSFLGNFPQAFSHVALVNSILNLNRERAPMQKRAQTNTPSPDINADNVAKK